MGPVKCSNPFASRGVPRDLMLRILSTFTRSTLLGLQCLRPILFELIEDRPIWLLCLGCACPVRHPVWTV